LPPWLLADGEAGAEAQADEADALGRACAFAVSLLSLHPANAANPTAANATMPTIRRIRTELSNPPEDIATGG
jgi:hypothetical protein